MKHPLPIVLLVLMAAACHPTLSPVQQGNKYGYTNKKGDTVIPVKYFDAKPFHDGWARVAIKVNKVDSIWYESVFETGGYWQVDEYQIVKYVFINEEDSMMALKLDAALNFNQGLAAVAQKGVWGYINTNGEWVISRQYAEASSFKKGKAQVTKESDDGLRWFYLTINENNEVLIDDQVGKRKPDRFDSIPDWRTLMASGEVYIRLTDYSTAFDYYLAAARRLDQIEVEDTFSYMRLCQQTAMLGAIRVNHPIYEKYDQLAREKFEEIVASNIERRRRIILEYIQYLVELATIRENNLEKDLEKETLERILDAVKRSGTEDIKLYWDIEERLKAFSD